MKTLAIIAVFFASATAFSAEPAKENMAEGAVYVYSVRNAPVFKQNGEIVPVKRGDLLHAKNLSVECGANQFAMLVLSNKTAVWVYENSAFVIESAVHTYPFTDRLNEKIEQVNSYTTIKVLNGRFYFSSLTPRASSSFLIKSGFGEIWPSGRTYCVFLTENELQVTSIEGRIEVKLSDGISDFIKQMQIGKITLKDGKAELLLENLRVTNLETYKKETDKCALALNGVEFNCDEKSNAVTARRVISKSLVLIPAKKDKSK